MNNAPRRLAFAFLLVCVSHAGSARAQDLQQEFAALRYRVDTLEQQNRELEQQLQRLPRTEDGPPLRNAADSTGEGTEFTSLERRLTDLEAKVAPEKPKDEKKKPPEWYEVGSDSAMTASWKNGLEITSKNKDFRVHVGGRTQMDTGWFGADQNVQQNINIPYRDGVDFRRGRLRIDGTMYEVIDWAVEYDFFNSFSVDGAERTAPAPTDLWWQIKELPYVGNVRVGNQKPAIGFEHLVSSRFLPFMERSYNQDSFYGGGFNGFQPGVSIFDTVGEDELASWTLGVYKPTNNVFAFNANNGDYELVSRVTKLLWYADDGNGLLHVGFSGLQQSTVGNRTVFRTRDAIRTGLSVDWPVPASTGTIAGDDMQWLNAELAAVYGPLTLQGEYLVSGLHDAATIAGGVVQPSVGTVTYNGGYVQSLFFLTGEHDNYDKKRAAFDRVKPNENFFLVRDERGFFCSGLGAWQIGARYNYLDLNDNGINGGILHNGTLGLNWFLNPNMKVQLNYMATHRDAALAANLGDGWINGWGLRVAHDF